jgi:uncharacterized membrane protein YhdT
MNETKEASWVASVVIVLLAITAIIALIENHLQSLNKFSDPLAILMTILFAICGYLAIRYGRKG